LSTYAQELQEESVKPSTTAVALSVAPIIDGEVLAASPIVENNCKCIPSP
jgi:hypothetical protein